MSNLLQCAKDKVQHVIGTVTEYMSPEDYADFLEWLASEVDILEIARKETAGQE